MSLSVPLSPFADSMAHLLAELERLDLLLRAQVASMRRVLAHDPAFRGMYIGEDEVLALLAQPAGQPRWPLAEAPAVALAGLGQDIAARCRVSEAQGVELRLPRLQRQFGLGDLERDLLLLAMAVDLDLRYERLFGYLQDDVTRKRPGAGLLIDLLASSSAGRLQLRRCLDAQAALRSAHLIEWADDAALPPLARAVLVPQRVVDWLLGSDAVDSSLDPAVRLLPTTGGLELRVPQGAALGMLKQLAVDVAAGRSRVLQLTGARGAGKREAARAIAHELGRPLLEVDLEALLADGSFEVRVPLILREARLQAAALYCSGFDGLLAASRRPVLVRWLQQAAGHVDLLVLAGRQAFEPADELRGLPFVRVALPPLDAGQRAALWRAELPILDAAGVDADVLAGKFRFGPEQLRDAAASVRRSLAQGASPLSAQGVQEACRLHSNQQLGAVARKITPRYRWSDIVLPPDRLTLLRDICNHMKYRGRVYGEWGFGGKLAMGKGLSVLFAGPSGTGKTMAADIIAGELGLDLFKIDLASVISKYIGETEKNLGSLFDEAETSNAILFFDEADALFGKRTEVRDSHDRYANVEVGYLLQRLEEYEGVAILATNFRKNMDEAFVRRLHFTVEFPFPGVADRRSIWRSVWPREMPRDPTVDAADLGQRFEMTGGNIRNVALAAAFLAADDGGQLRLGHVMRATQREFQKMGKLVDDKAFAELA